MGRILGLDMGTNSIGWALIDPDSKKIVGTGVRIFPEGINEKNQESRNLQRRSARLNRHCMDHYQERRRKLQNYLLINGLYPNSKNDEEDFFKYDPYEIRKKGLDEKLSLYEIGRVLFHINQKRGFKSSRKIIGNNDNKIFKGYEDKIGINDLEKEIKRNGYRTLGEYLAYLNPEEQRRRNRLTLRSMYKDEVDILLNVQKYFYPTIITEEFIKCIKEIIFFQRKPKSQKNRVSFCTFEKQKRCAPKSSPVYQYFRILETVVRIRVTTDERFDEPLTDEERFTLIDKLNQTDHLEIEKIKKVLDLPRDTHINLKDQTKILGNRTYAALSKVFGTNVWNSFSNEKKWEIWHTIYFAYENEWLEEHAQKKWLLTYTEAKQLTEVSLEPEHCRLSTKAMLKIIPFLEKGLTYDKACLEAGYHHSDIYRPDHLADELPEPANIRNPLVQQALYETRKLVNSIIKAYGKPDMIRVELWRKLKASKKKREEILKDNKSKENLNGEAKSFLKNDLKFVKITSDAIQKYLLWKECNHKCPYTGKTISESGLFNGDFEIEHIIPKSRSLDNSMANKTLCHWSVNHEKGNQTPYEAFGNDSQRWHEIITRLKTDMPNMPKNKINKFMIKEVRQEIDDNFFHHQYTDTAYISREVTKYLKLICPKVQTTKGGATAQLRQMWGLNKILTGNEENKKNREDQRHHAIDALVITQVSPGVLKKLSEYYKYNSISKLVNFPEPWEHFHSDVSNAVDRILISYKRKKRVRGKLHEDTYYGKILTPEGKETYVVRQPVKSLTPKEIGNVVDPVVRKVIRERLQSMGVDTSTKFKDIPKDAFTSPLYMPNGKTRIKKVRIIKDSETMYQLYKDNEKLFVQTGSNHHIEIFKHKNGGKSIGRVINLLDALKRQKNGLPVIDKIPPDDNYEFLYSLAINEMVIIDSSTEILHKIHNKEYEKLTSHLYRVKEINGLSQQITFIQHHISGTEKKYIKCQQFSKVPGQLNAIKVIIDPIGNIITAND